MPTHRPLPISPDHQDEILDELAKLREEIVNTRHVVIKTDHLIKNLNAEVKQVTIKQSNQDSHTRFCVMHHHFSLGLPFLIATANCDFNKQR